MGQPVIARADRPVDRLEAAAASRRVWFQVMARPCEPHRAPRGRPCWAFKSSDGRELTGLCGARIERAAMTFYEHHEPSVWLRRVAEAAAMKIAADADGHPLGDINLIVPLVPYLARDRCARCGHADAERDCGMRATSTHLPGTTLKFVFRLCTSCAVREYGESAAADFDLPDIEVTVVTLELDQDQEEPDR